MEYALLGRRMPVGEDPLRTHRRALMAGCGAALGIGLVITAFPDLRAGPGDSPLVMSRQSGALFVRVADRLRPVTNLVSAELIMGAPARPRLVDDAALDTVSRGPVLGIPGAPDTVGAAIPSEDHRWRVCDQADGLTTIAVAAATGPPVLESGTAVVVSAAHGDGSVYLLYDGRRARIDPDNPATARAFHLDGVRPQPVSSTLLNAIPEAPAITAPAITGTSADIAGVPVGGVLRTARAGSEEFYVVLPEGIQRIGQLTADLIRFANRAAGAELPTVAPDVIADATLVDSLAVGSYPDAAPRLLDTPADICATWHHGMAGIAAGAAGPDAAGAVPLAGADGTGPNVDIVAVPPGYHADVTPVSAAAGRYLITDAGIAFPVRDSAAASAMGLEGQPEPVPWAIIAALPAGPELSKDAALAGWDVPGGAAP